MIHAHIFYFGTVQGIGFRYTVHRYASKLDLKGWVRNVEDGSVEIRVEGSRDSIDQLCQDLDEHFDGYIRDKKVDIENINEQFKGFNITQ